jgi:hypothetical protein
LKKNTINKNSLIGLIVLNPFVFSGLLPLNTDINVFYFCAPLLFSIFYKKHSILFLYFLLLLMPLKYGFYIINIVFISFFNIKKIKIVEKSIILWIILLLLEIFFPTFYDVLFFRDTIVIADRGFNSFGPEPATTGFFALGVFLLFKDKLSAKYRILINIIIFATFNFPIILSYLFLLFFDRIKGFSLKRIFYGLLLICTFFIVIFFNKNSFPLRFNLMLDALLNKDIYYFVLNDSSIQTRFNQIFNIIPGQNNLSDNINSSGIPVLFNYYGILSWFFIIYIIYKMKFSLNRIVLFTLFLFTGSFAHFMPLKFLISKYEKNISLNSSL